MSPPSHLVSPAQPFNLAEHYLERNLGRGYADKTAIVVDHPGRGVARYSYREVSALSARYGHALARRGLGLEDRLFIILEDGIEWAATFFGAQKLGVTTMFLNPNVTADELAFYLADSRARGVVTTRAVAERLPTERPYLRAVVTVDDPAFAAEVAELPAALTTAATTAEDFAVWLYSSGSTGAPKAAVHRAYDFVYNTERYPVEVLKMTDADVTLSVPKLFFGYATGSNLLFPFHFGGTAVLFPDKPTPERLFELVERHRATILVNVPTMIAQMATAYTERPRDLSSLRLLKSAGEALPPELYARWKAATGVEILDGIGSAEMFHIFISARLGEVVPGSLGRLVTGYDAKIVDDDGVEVGPGEVGTLWVKGDSAAAFYWQRADKSREVLQGRWVVSSDRFMRDTSGLYWYRGRADDVLKVGGRWLSPLEIEDVLVKHPAVAEAGASSFAKDGLTKPMAFVILRPGVEATPALEAELVAHVGQHLENFKVPRFVEAVAELPRSDRDKLARKPLAALAREAARRRGVGDAT